MVKNPPSAAFKMLAKWPVLLRLLSDMRVFPSKNYFAGRLSTGPKKYAANPVNKEIRIVAAVPSFVSNPLNIMPPIQKTNMNTSREKK